MKRGEIYYLQMYGHDCVQAGLRPVIVVQNDIGNLHSPNTIVCGITSQVKQPLPTHVYLGTSGGLTKKSTVLCEQIRTVSKEDLKDYIGCISNPRTLQRLDKGIRISLGLDQKEVRTYDNQYTPRYSNRYEPRRRYNSGIHH